MNDSIHKININSFNTRGLRNDFKRNNIFKWLKNSHPGISMIQESHSIIIDHDKWAKEWNGLIFFSDGNSNSKGVATLIPQELLEAFELIETKKDDDGRFLLINCKIHDIQLILINIYSPTKDNPTEQNNLYNYLHEKIEEYSDMNIILGGDLNTYLNINLDKKGGRAEKQSTFSESMNNLCNEFTLTDIWRVRNPKTHKYTRIERSRNGIVQSRLDYLLTSLSLTYQINATNISPGNSSDHSIISLSLNLTEPITRGKGYWKFNNNLLIDKDYVKLINNKISEIKDTVNMTDKNQLWEYTKCQLRTDTLLYSCKKSKENKRIENELQKQLIDFENKLSTKIEIEDTEYHEYTIAKAEWERHIARKNHGIILRSKAKWVEEGEKNTKYFLNLEKRNFNNTCIKTLMNKDNQEITDMKQILQEQKRFYKKLYTSKTNKSDTYQETLKYFTEDNQFPFLTDIDKNDCDIPITLNECSKALQLLPNNKSPGSDGFTTNFYKFFWKDIKDLVFQSFNHSFESQKLSSFQRMGILNLLPKKDKDLRHLANWRPVSLLNTDYKILTKLLAMRLQKVIPSLVNSDQVGYIKNRYIGENIRILSDILQLTDIEEIEAYITQIDFEKAFDSIEWDFLFTTLKVLNFGDNFISWIKTLYTDISACAGNNGNYSEYFTLSRSIRQGCPISALLFLLVVEILANKIRNDQTIKGVKINNEIYKLAMMADDITLINKDIQSIANAIVVFNKFEKCSGLKLNLNKTDIIPIGSQRGKDLVVPMDLKQIKVKHGPFKALGVWFSLNIEESTNLNLTERIKSMSMLINIWKGRKLSLKGKITILRTLILPQIQFLFSMIAIPDKILKQLDKLFFDYLWDNKPAKVKRSTIIGSIDQGGLAMIDVYEIHAAAKCNWIKRLHVESESKWKTAFLQLLNVPKNLLNKNLDPVIIRNCKSEFHKQTLTAWIKVFCKEPTTFNDIINQYLVYNKAIKINNKYLTQYFFKSKNKDNIYKMKVLDMLDPLNNFFCIKDFNLKNETALTILDYNALKSSIPSTWKNIMLRNTNQIKKESHEPKLLINNIRKPITLIKSKELYNNLVIEKIKTPTAIETWINMYPFLEKYDWKAIYSIPFNYTREPYLQSFQYKIINRILNTNEKLEKWSIKDTNKCNFCKSIDTIEHHLYQCTESKKIWDNLEDWLFNHIEIRLNLKECEILFGIPNATNEYLELINYMIIVTKWYINSKRSKEEPLYFLELINITKTRIKILILSNNMNDRPNKAWQDMLDEIM